MMEANRQLRARVVFYHEARCKPAERGDRFPNGVVHIIGCAERDAGLRIRKIMSKLKQNAGAAKNE